jgi:hypothetical protein
MNSCDFASQPSSFTVLSDENAMMISGGWQEYVDVACGSWAVIVVATAGVAAANPAGAAATALCGGWALGRGLVAILQR